MSQIAKAKAFFLPKLRQVFHFLMKQGLAMGGNLLYGLLCVRMLPVSDYAKFAVLFGYMGSLTVLLDIGIAGTLAPLVGEQIGNLPLIANYIASIRRIALKLYLVVTPVASLIFVLLVQKQHWGWLVVSQMIATLLVIAWFARVSSSYGSILILRRDRSYYYRAQIMGSLGSLGLLVIFWLFHSVNIYVGILLNVAQVLFIAMLYFRRARVLLQVKGTPSPQQEKAIVRLAMPNMPSVIFYAIQGQITLMLITVFGHGTTSVADVGALSRLSQILVLFSQMNPILVEPFFARLQAGRLKRTYLLTLAIVVIASGIFSAIAFLFPEIFLWVLGPKYKELRIEVGLVILGSAIRYVGGFLWVVHSARRFVYWWNNFANILLTILVQAFFIWKYDLSTVRNVLILNIVSAALALLITLATGLYGFIFGPQKIDRAAEA
jgi:O-antigen/teichoic acid export membrane protein